MRWRAPLILALLVAGGWWGLNRLLRPENLGAWLVSMIEQRTGLQVRVSSPARLDLLGDLRVSMDGLDLSLRDSGRSVLRAERLRVALDWSSLWGEVSIRQIELQQPSLDVSALQAWLDSDAAVPANASAPTPLPKLGALVIEDGLILLADRRIEQVQASLTQSSGADSARLGASLRMPWPDRPQSLQVVLEAGSVRFDPRIDMDAVRLSLAVDDEALVDAQGELSMDTAGRGSARFEADPIRWPESVLGAQPDWAQTFTALPIQVLWTRPDNGAGTLRIASAPGAVPSTQADLPRFDVSGDPAALLAWWEAGRWWQPPPWTTQAEVPSVTYSGVTIDGLHVRVNPRGKVEDDAVPAKAATSPGPPTEKR